MKREAKHHRRSIRLPDYDYTSEGAYFITIVTHQRELLFGEVNGDEIELNTLGCIVETEWRKTAIVRPYVQLDEYIVMPNHFHAILFINYADIPDAQNKVRADRGIKPADSVRATRRVAPTGPKSGSLGAIIGQFKSIVSKQINKTTNTPSQKRWLRNYYERIIRNDEELNAIRQYILSNPAQWTEDEHYPGE